MNQAGYLPFTRLTALLLLFLQTVWLHTSVSNAELVFLGQAPFRAFTSQGARTGDTIYQFFVVDTTNQDSVNVEVTFSSPQTNSLPFVLVPDNGQLLITDSFLEVEYSFTVEAASGAVTIATNITVTVVPLSNTAPRFEHAQYQVEVSEDLPSRSAFSVIRAFTLNSEATAQEYSIVAGNTDSDLSIISNTGLLRIDRSLDRERTAVYQLTIRYVDDVTSVDSPVQVSVLDVNDQSPQFSKSLYNITIAETLPIGSSIVTVNASDADVGTNAQVTYLLDPTARNTFTLEQEDGVLRTAALLDYERQPQYQFRVTVVDMGVPSLSSVATILINLMNIDDECPRFENPAFIEELAYDVTGTPPDVGTVILTVMATDPDRFSEVTYSLVSGHTDVLELNTLTGEITLARTDIDPRGQYTLNVSASDQNCSGQSFVTVEIGIGNINDHSPQFRTECTASLLENPPVGTEVVTLLATDGDIGFNGLVTYSLLSGSNMFEIDASSGVVRTTASPEEYDRETLSTFQVGVTASDGGNRQDYCSLTVTLVDENDNPPRIPLTRYSTSLTRDSRQDSFVIQITADDPDVGDNGRISYSIDHPSPLPFAINNNSGVITISGMLSSSQDEYTFTVVAADMGPAIQLSSSTMVIIDLTDSDELPKFEQQNYTVHVCENTPSGTPILNVSVSSPPSSGIVAYAILAGTDYRSNSQGTFELLTVSPNVAEIRVGFSTLVNFEDLSPNPSFEFFVQAESIVGSSIVPVEIFVTDDDDSPPVFLSDVSITIAENEPVGTTVAQVQAVDRDSGTNGQVRYRLVTGSSTYFNVTEDGVIVSNREFDFETGTNLRGRFSVEAFNPNPLPTNSTCPPSGPRATRTTAVDWVVLDQNDNPPLFPESLYSTQVREDVPIQSKLLRLNATDLDVSDLGRLSFLIVSGNDGTFGIESHYIILTRRLDYETNPTYELVIQVTDGVHAGQDCPHCVTMVRIQVTDVDDEPPVFSSPVYRADVVENAPVGTSVLTLSANDIDSSSILYDLRGLAEGRFSVDQSGVVSVSGPIDREQFPGGSLVFLAFAEGGSLATADVIINIEDVNDYEPRFSGVFRGRVEENSLPGEAGLYVSQVRAVDLDQGENGTIRYSILSGGESGFRINDETGVITAHAQYDREVTPSYIITVEARDNGSPLQLSSQTEVIVEIGDANDNKAIFPFTYMYARVFENSPLGRSVIRLPAIDPDNGTNATVTYSLVSFTPPEVKFALNSDTGEVTIAGSLDYEIPLHRTYNLTVSVMDPQFPPASTGTLQIDLIDENDNIPTIAVNQLMVKLQETFPLGVPVAMVTASDEDSGVNSELVFEISSGNENGDFALTVDEPGVGMIKSAQQLDYETTLSYTLTVTVSDRGFPRQTASAQLQFNVLDVNDEPPVFAESVYSVSIAENTAPSSNLLQVEATDRDTGIGGMIQMYEIVDGNEGGQFSLTPSGRLDSLMVFDREERSEYTLTIAAQDGGADPLTGTAKIVVTITDVNDNPSFNGGHLTVLIHALNGEIAPGEIAPLYFIDPDVDDTFMSCLVISQSHPAETFHIDGDTCTIYLDNQNPREGSYKYLLVRGRENTHVTVNASATIVVEHILTSQLPQESLVTVTVNASTESYITERLNISFPLQLAQVLELPEESIRVVTVQRGHYLPDTTVDITFTARDDIGRFTSPTEILHKLYVLRDSLTIAGHNVLSLPLDACVNEPCQNQAECRTIQTFLTTEKVASTRQFAFFAPRIQFSYKCTCVPGTSGDHCEVNFNDCYSSPCQQGAQCTDLVNGFSCDCPDGYGGQDCSIPPDECLTNLCQHGGTCTIIEDTISCSCLPGYYGSQCEYHYFFPSTFCSQGNPCQNEAECSAGRDGVSCICQSGFSGERCEMATQVQGGCVGNPCYNGSTCIDTLEGSTCQCSIGFTGPKCRWPLNNCELQPCFNGGVCETGLYGSYRCSCLPGYTGDNCSSLIPSCLSSPCLNHGQCLDREDGTYSCTCVPGYYGDHCELSSEPTDLCSLEDCSINGNCTSGRDALTCSCIDGFTGNDCSISDINEDPCTQNPCLHGGACEPASPSGYTCSCSVGFTGANCEDNINDCADDPCVNGGTCRDGINGYICSCPSNLAGNECQVYCPEGQSGVFCQTPVLHCTDRPCENSGTCVEAGSTFNCVCPPTHTGERCETRANCSLTTCLNGGTCLELPAGGTECVCSSDFTGDNCELLTVSFSGSQRESSYRAFDSLDIRGQGRIEFELATVDENGLFLYNTQFQNGQSEDFIAVEVVDGALYVSISHGNGQHRVSSPQNVADGLWHHVSIETAGKEFRVLLDDCLLLPDSLLPLATSCIIRGATPGTSSFLDLGLPLWLGGVPFSLSNNSTHISSQGVTGCMRRVKINGLIQDLEGYMLERNSQRGCHHLESEVCKQNSSACGGGRCVPVWEGHSCDCPPRVEGEACERGARSVMYGGGTFAEYSLLDYTLSSVTKRQSSVGLRSTTTDQITLWFRTEMTRGHGLLLYMGNEESNRGDELYIQLEDGFLILHINLGSQEEQLLISNKTVADSAWHQVEVTRMALELSIAVDNVTFQHTLQGTHLSLDVSPTIYTGGRPDLAGAGILTPLTGCLEDIRINQNPLPTAGSNGFASVVFNGDSAVSYNCALGACLRRPCGRGNCSELGTADYECDCEVGVRTVSLPCPPETPPPMYTLVIVFGAVAGGLLVCVVVTLLGMLWFRRRSNRRHSLMFDSSDNNSEGALDILSRQCLVISNEAGGGEQDTHMGVDEWSHTLIPNGHTVQEKELQLSSSSTSIDKPVLTGTARATSPTIGAFIQEKIEAIPKEYRDIDSLCEFAEEGNGSVTGSLSSICSSIADSEYTVEKLKQAGPELAPFVDLLASVLAEEDDAEDEDGESQQAHTGNTQLTQGTLYSQDLW